MRRVAFSLVIIIVIVYSLPINASAMEDTAAYDITIHNKTITSNSDFTELAGASLLHPMQVITSISGFPWPEAIYTGAVTRATFRCGNGHSPGYANSCAIASKGEYMVTPLTTLVYGVLPQTSTIDVYRTLRTVYTAVKTPPYDSIGTSAGTVSSNILNKTSTVETITQYNGIAFKSPNIIQLTPITLYPNYTTMQTYEEGWVQLSRACSSCGPESGGSVSSWIAHATVSAVVPMSYEGLTSVTWKTSNPSNPEVYGTIGSITLNNCTIKSLPNWITEPLNSGTTVTFNNCTISTTISSAAICKNCTFIEGGVQYLNASSGGNTHRNSTAIYTTSGCKFSSALASGTHSTQTLYAQHNTDYPDNRLTVSNKVIVSPNVTFFENPITHGYPRVQYLGANPVKSLGDWNSNGSLLYWLSGQTVEPTSYNGLRNATIDLTFWNAFTGGTSMTLV